MAVCISNLSKPLPCLGIFSSVVTFVINAPRTREKKCPWMKNRQLLLLYIQSARFSQIVEMREGSDSWERESSGPGSRERCYQSDEGTKRSLRIIESYDCLFRASAIRGCNSRWIQYSLSSYVSADRLLSSANFLLWISQDDDITTRSQSFLVSTTSFS